MSTDFVAETKNGANRRLHAYSVKQARDLDERVLEKLAIEEAYWTRRDVPWTLLLDTELPQTRVANMELVFDFHDPDSLPCPPRIAALVAEWLHPHAEAELCALRTLGAQCDRALKLERGTSLAVAYHCIVNHRWSIDWDQPILPLLRFADSDAAANLGSATRDRAEGVSADGAQSAEVCHGR